MNNSYFDAREKFIENAMKEMTNFFQDEENYIFFGEWSIIINFFELMVRKLRDYYDKYSLVERRGDVVDTLDSMLDDIERIREEDHAFNDDNLNEALTDFFSKFASIFPRLWD